MMNCPKCDEPMKEVSGWKTFNVPDEWECENPECPRSPKFEETNNVPAFIFCGVCHNPRDLYKNVDDLWVVEECDECGDEHYAYPIQGGEE